MSAVKPLTNAELGAWDLYASAVLQTSLASWFRWKQGTAIDYKQVLAETCALADALTEERRKR